ncbi:MAG: AarF/UbiB family protein, partial [Pseudomonadales bacterium]
MSFRRYFLGRIAERVYRSARIGYTAASVWLRYKLPRWWDARRGRDPDERDMAQIHQRNADQIYATAVSMRGMLVKMCQVIGTRSDIFPPQYVKTLAQCHDALPPRDIDTIRGVIEEDFARPIGEIFSDIEPTPVAAASLAQVHGATLTDGRKVAVKVQYPDIEHIIGTDLTASRRVAAIYSRFDRNPMDFLPLLDELQRHLRMELDFRREVESAERIRELFKDDPTVVIPSIYPE